jgi:hypothetical protein
MRQPFAFGETTAARECCSGSLGLNVSTQPDTRPSREGRPRQPPLRLTLRRVSSRRPALGKIEPGPPEGEQRDECSPAVRTSTDAGEGCSCPSNEWAHRAKARPFWPTHGAE